jgi:hypothetical protein
MKRPAYTLLKKIVRMRTYLIKKHIGKHNLQLIIKLDKISVWLDAWPNAPEHGCINFMKQNYADLMMLIPSCKAGSKLVSELNSLTK